MATELKTYYDENCPSCGFPETIRVSNEETMETLRFECSKGCGWKQEVNGVYS